MSHLKKTAITIVILAWLLPILPVGLFFRTTTCILPRQAAYFYNIGCLFSKRTPSWPRYFVEGQKEDGTWIEIPYKEHFHIQPFGHRKRFDRVMAKQKKDPRIMGHLASWIRRRHNTSQQKAENKVERVRLISASFKSTPERPYPWPKLEEVPNESRRIIFEERLRLTS